MAARSVSETSFQITGGSFAKGGNGRIYPAIEIFMPGIVQPCVAKKNKDFVHEAEKENYLLLRKEKVPHVVELLSYDDIAFTLYLERVPDDLFKACVGKKKKPLPLKDYMVIAGSMLETMSHFERLNLVFPDFTPSNMAWDPLQRKWKMFDLSSIHDPSKDPKYKASPWSYKPLEVLFELSYTHKVNTWLIGVALYELAAQEDFSTAENPLEALNDIEDRCMEDVPAHMIDASPQKAYFYHPKAPGRPYQRRRSNNQFLPFWTEKMKPYQLQFVKLMSKMLLLDPQQRIAASEALLTFKSL